VGRGSEDPCTYERIGGSGVRGVEEWGGSEESVRVWEWDEEVRRVSESVGVGRGSEGSE
jgi:hypothetical protein